MSAGRRPAQAGACSDGPDEEGFRRVGGDRSRMNTGELGAIEATHTRASLNRDCRLSHQLSPKPRTGDAGAAGGAVRPSSCFTERCLGRAWLSCDRKRQSLI